LVEKAAFGIFWFLLLLLPSGLLAAINDAEPMAERRVYLATAGLFLVAGAASEQVWEYGSEIAGVLRVVCAAAFAMLLFSLAGRAIARNVVWRDPVVLWQEAADRSPASWLPRTVLGESLHKAGRHEQAIVAYRQALALNPQDELSYLKLAVCLAELGRVSEAGDSLAALEKIHPASPIVPIGRGAVSFIADDMKGARANFEHVLSVDPRNVMALQWLAVLEESAGNPSAALIRCEQVEQLMPGSLSAEDCVRRNRANVSGGQTR